MHNVSRSYSLLFNKSRKLIKEEGLARLAGKFPGYLYRNYIRFLLPTVGYQIYNDIKVNQVKAGDHFLPERWRGYRDVYRVNYESALVNGLKNQVKPGDIVVLIGGGRGVTTCVASRLTGEKGQVICFEAAIESYYSIKKTLKLNDVQDNVTLINRSVGIPVSISGELSENKIMEPNLLPSCDILELDCEGSEREILSNLKIRPRTILAETHGMYRSPTVVIEDLLKKKDYRIENIEVADADLEEFCMTNDIKVITAHRCE